MSDLHPAVAEYLAHQPAERRTTLDAVRTVIREHLDPRIEEGMQYGMIGYYVPHALYPAGYHCDPRQPLPYAGLAAQKNHLALYLMPLYLLPEEATHFQSLWRLTGKKLDMGKSCIRFKRLEDVALDAIAEALQRIPAERYLNAYQVSLKSAAKPTAKPAAKPTAKPTAKSAPKNAHKSALSPTKKPAKK
jgi:hypothetical protein